MTKWMHQHFEGIPCSTGNISTGPFSAGQRPLTTVVYVEFINQDVRNAVFSDVSSRNLSFSYNGKNINIKRALTKKIRSKIWVLKQVESLLRNDGRCNGMEITTVNDNGLRTIKVRETVAFR